MELYILSKQDLSILSICKLADYQINLDEETNAKSTFTLMKTNGLKKENYMVLNGLYRQFIFVIDDVQTEKESDVVTVTTLDISNIFDRKVIEKNIDIMKSKSIEEFLANTISENFVNSDDTALNVNYIEIYWHTNTQGNVATNAENGLYNFHTFLTNCRQYKNIYTDFKLENLGKPQIIEGKRISVEAKNRKIVDISLHGESTQNGTPTPDNKVDIENIEGKNKFKNNYEAGYTTTNNGVTFTVNKDKSITANGTATDTVTFIFATNIKLKKGTYTVSGITSGSSSTYSITISGLTSIYNVARTHTINADTTYVNAFIRVNSGVTVDNVTFYPMIEEGTVATTYVPYNSLEFKVEGKNKFDKSKKPLYRGGMTIEETSDGLNFIIAPNKNFAYVIYDLGKLEEFKNKTLTLKLLSPQDLSYFTNSAFVELNLDGTGRTMIGEPLGANNSQLTTTIVSKNNYERLGLRLYLSDGITAGATYNAYNIQVEEGTVATDYEPYKSQVAYFPLEEGEKLYQGSFLNDNGKNYTRKQFEIDVTQIRAVTSYNNIDYASIPKPSDFLGYNNYIYYEILCNKAISQKITSWDNIENINKISSQAEKTKFYLGFEKGTTLEQMKTALANTVIEYELAEPETVPYTEEQQEAWNNIKNLTLFEGVNHISSDANMVLKYYPLEPVGLKFVLRIDIENKQETTELIDTTLPEVADYNKIYEEDVTAKVQVYIREDRSEYNLYLKTDRTTTTNKDDPDRASGKIEVISVETADRAEEEALNVMKGNNYKHLVEFKIAKTSKLMDITKLHIRKTYKNQNRRRYI